MKKKINACGYDYVDLELPSGTLWATCNVGALSPEESGLYFQWGDTIGYTKEQIGIGDGQKKFERDWSDYKFSINGSNTSFSKYTTKGDVLELEDDAAHTNMGGDWHMPTPNQIKELVDNTINTWTTQDGVNGRLFTSKNNGNSIFISAAGGVWGGSVGGRGSSGYVWSSMLSSSIVGFGQSLDFGSVSAHLGSSSRSNGFSVRGVIG